MWQSGGLRSFRFASIWHGKASRKPLDLCKEMHYIHIHVCVCVIYNTNICHIRPHIGYWCSGREATVELLIEHLLGMIVIKINRFIVLDLCMVTFTTSITVGFAALRSIGMFELADLHSRHLVWIILITSVWSCKIQGCKMRLQPFCQRNWNNDSVEGVNNHGTITVVH